MTGYNYKEPNSKECAETMRQVNIFCKNLKRKIHDTVTGSGKTSVLTKDPKQNA